MFENTDLSVMQLRVLYGLSGHTQLKHWVHLASHFQTLYLPWSTFYLMTAFSVAIKSRWKNIYLFDVYCIRLKCMAVCMKGEMLSLGWLWGETHLHLSICPLVLTVTVTQYSNLHIFRIYMYIHFQLLQRPLGQWKRMLRMIIKAHCPCLLFHQHTLLLFIQVEEVGW